MNSIVTVIALCCRPGMAGERGRGIVSSESKTMAAHTWLGQLPSSRVVLVQMLASCTGCPKASSSLTGNGSALHHTSAR